MEQDRVTCGGKAAMVMGTWGCLLYATKVVRVYDGASDCRRIMVALLSITLVPMGVQDYFN
jgi:hypothetical protein